METKQGRCPGEGDTEDHVFIMCLRGKVFPAEGMGYAHLHRDVTELTPQGKTCHTACGSWQVMSTDRSQAPAWNTTLRRRGTPALHTEHKVP